MIFSNSFIAFLNSIASNDVVAKAILDNIDKSDTDTILTTARVNYITRNKDGNISYLPHGKDHVVNADNKWDLKNRQNAKPGRVIKLLFKNPELFNEKQYNEFAMRCIGAVSTEDNFKILSKGEITGAYTRGVIDSQGSLSGSCMNKKPSEYFELYEDYCKMVVLYNEDNDLIGRALLWENVSDEDGDTFTFMDRIYGIDSTIEKFIAYAKINGWAYKPCQSAGEYELKTPEGEVIEDFCIELADFNVDKYEYFPYLDTFRHICTYPATNKTIMHGHSLRKEKHVKGYQVQNTDGTIHDYDFVRDRYTTSDVEFCTAGQYTGYSTETEKLVQIGTDLYYHTDEALVFNSRDNKYLLKKDMCLVNCGRKDGQYINKESATILPNGFTWETNDYIEIVEALKNQIIQEPNNKFLQEVLTETLCQPAIVVEPAPTMISVFKRNYTKRKTLTDVGV